MLILTECVVLAEEGGLAGHLDAEVLVGEAGGDAAAWGAVEEALELEQR